MIRAYAVRRIARMLGEILFPRESDAGIPAEDAMELRKKVKRRRQLDIALERRRRYKGRPNVQLRQKGGCLRPHAASEVVACAVANVGNLLAGALKSVLRLHDYCENRRNRSVRRLPDFPILQVS
jgi:hypothetical protein